MVYFNCVVAICVLCLFAKVTWVGLQSLIVTFPGCNFILEKKTLARNLDSIKPL